VSDDAVPRVLLDELRELVDRRPELLRERIGEMPPADRQRVLYLLLAIDATRRTLDALAHEPGELPLASPEALADVLDEAKRLSDALDGIESFDGLLAGAFTALSPAEAHLLVFERSFRRLWERRTGEGGS